MADVLRPKERAEAGFAFLSVLLTLAALGLLGLAGSIGTQTELGIAVQHRSAKAALSVAEAGAAHAWSLIRATPDLDDILAAMSDELRAVFVLHDIERLTMAEIAEVLDLKPGTVASRLRRARKDFDQRVARLEAQQKGKGDA